MGHRQDDEQDARNWEREHRLDRDFEREGRHLRAARRRPRFDRDAQLERSALIGGGR